MVKLPKFNSVGTKFIHHFTMHMRFYLRNQLFYVLRLTTKAQTLTTQEFCFSATLFCGSNQTILYEQLLNQTLHFLFAKRFSAKNNRTVPIPVIHNPMSQRNFIKVLFLVCKSRYLFNTFSIFVRIPQVVDLCENRQTARMQTIFRWIFLWVRIRGRSSIVSFKLVTVQPVQIILYIPSFLCTQLDTYFFREKCPYSSCHPLASNQPPHLFQTQ